MKIDMEKLIQLVMETQSFFTNEEAASQVTVKGVSDYVTQVDYQVQEFLKERLREEWPDFQFMGEEKDNSDIDFDGTFWILDPVDGTTNLIHSFRHSAISLALAEGGQIVFGVVYNPYTEECFAACRGGGALRNGVPIHVSDVSRLEDSLLSTGTVPGRRELADAAFRQMRALYDRCQDVRRTGCASLDLCWVACGRLDGYVELSLQPWDYAAGMRIAAEAGGKVTAPDGSPLSLREGGPLLASNGRLHSALQAILKE